MERVSNRLPSYNDPFGVLECVVLDAFWNGFGAVYYFITIRLGCENRGPRRSRPRRGTPISGQSYDPVFGAIERVQRDFRVTVTGTGWAPGMGMG